MRVIKLGLALALAVSLVACQKTGKGAGNVDGARIAAADTNADWVSYGKGYSEQRFSPLDKVNATNVGSLGLRGSVTALGSFIKVGPLRASGLRMVSMRPSCAIDPRRGSAVLKASELIG